MEVNVVNNGQLAKNAVLTDELHNDDKTVDRRTLSENKKYHVFFCYRDVPNDKLWVKEVVNKLENDGYICCDHEKDFIPGTKTMYNIKYAIQNSEKVVTVLSNEALDSGYLAFETEMAYKEGIDKNENLLIPVLLDDCDIPGELKLLTYIDARKEINERIWWPKLIAAIESKGGCSFFKGRKEEQTKHESDDQPTFYIKTLCSLKTTFRYQQWSIQSTSKYIPRGLASMDDGVSVETIKNIKRDLLDVPIIRRKQNCCCFVTGCICLFLMVLGLGFFSSIIVGSVFCSIATTTMTKEDCFLLMGICLVIEIVIGICCYIGWRSYCKEPRSLDKKIIEYNTELIKNCLLITLKSEWLWKTASVVFFRVSIEICKKYVLLHLREDRKIERKKVFSISGMEAQHDEDDVPHLTGSRNEDLVQATENVAMTLLMKYAHEYLRQVLNRKIKHPKEDRHKADYMCLCQYIEKTDKKFRKLVERNKITLSKSSSIEDITENKKRDAFRL